QGFTDGLSTMNSAMEVMRRSREAEEFRHVMRRLPWQDWITEGRASAAEAVQWILTQSATSRAVQGDSASWERLGEAWAIYEIVESALPAQLDAETRSGISAYFTDLAP